MHPYTIGNTDRLLDWISAHPGEIDRCEKLLTWTVLVCDNPEMFCTGLVTNTMTSRVFMFSDIPGAEVRVTFKVFESPVRAIWILDISSGLFQSS